MSAENDTSDAPALEGGTDAPALEGGTDAPAREGGLKLQPNTVSGTLIVAITLCLVCSLLVAGGAVLLRPRIDANKQLKKQRNVLIAAGLFDTSTNTDAQIPKLFESVETVLVNLPRRPATSEDDAGQLNQELSVENYDSLKAAKDPRQSVPIPDELDLAGIKRREQVAAAYIVKADDGSISQIVLPIYGKGLWSTMYGFLAIKADVQADFPVTGITFYQQGETPGLGGEVENPKWKAQWPGKHILTDTGEPILDVTKPGQAGGENEIDGLSGATITSNGVEGLVNYWLGPDGFGPFLERYREGDIEFTAETQSRGGNAEATASN